MARRNLASVGAYERVDAIEEQSFALRIHMPAGPLLSVVLASLRDVQLAYLALDLALEVTPDQVGIMAAIGPRPQASPRTDLILRRAQFASPGFLDFLGSLNPLTVIAEFIQQRHERKKDRDYRNQLEAQSLALQNALVANKVVAERVAILRDAGVSDADLRLYVERFLRSRSFVLASM